MASPQINSGTNKYSHLARRIDSQSGTRVLLVEALGESSEKEVSESITEGEVESEGLVQSPHLGTVLDLAGAPIISQTSSNRGVLKESTEERETSESEVNEAGETLAEGVQIVDTSQESEPVRPAKRRRTAQALEEQDNSTSSSPIQPISKRRRKLQAQSLAKNPTVEGRHLLRDGYEIEDSYEESRTFNLGSSVRIVVEIPYNENFDRDAYAKISQSSTQSSSDAVQQTPYHNPTPEQNFLPSRFDEVVIPDSQNLLGDSTTESVRPDTGGEAVVSLTATNISNWLRSENTASFLEASAPFENSPEVCFANSVPSTPQNSGSQSSESWQAAQIVPPLEVFASQIPLAGSEFEIFRDEVDNQGSASQQDFSQRSSKESVLSQRDNNSQHSVLRTSQAKSTDSVSHNNFANDESLILENNAARDTSQDFAERESSQPPQRPLSPSLNLSHRPGISASHSALRPHTPSDHEMAESAPTSAGSKLSYAERVAQARDRARARLSMPASPTNNEGVGSLPLHNVSYQMLPMRENIAGMPPNAVKENKNDDEQSNEVAQITLSLPPVKPADHVILLSSIYEVRKIYKKIIADHGPQIMDFLGGDEVHPVVLAQMDMMVETLKKCTDHQDLIDMSLTQSDLSVEEQAKWAESCSSKCSFLVSFLNALRMEEKHIAILARPGRMLNILESILDFNNLIYERPDRASRSGNGTSGSLRVTLLPTGPTEGQYVVSRADAVIAFDETFRVAEQYSTVLRAHLYDSGGLSPLISLVVAYSAEHLELCLPRFEDPIERKRCLISFITQTADKLLEPERAAFAVAEFLRSDCSISLLTQNPDIIGLKTHPNHHQQIESGLIALSQGQELLPRMTPQGPAKRALRADSISGLDIDSTKRMRMTPTRRDITSSGDITRISDTLGHRTQVLPTTVADSAFEDIAKVEALDEEEARNISSLLEQVDNLEVELLNKKNTEDELRSLVRRLEARLEDYASTLKKLEPRFLQSIADRRKLHAEHNITLSLAATLTQTVDTHTSEIARLKEDKVDLEKALAMARTALGSSTVPEIAQLAQTQEQLRTLQAEKDRLEKRVQSVQRDFEFTREAYQKASSIATELRNEVTELQEEKTILQRKASENIVRVAAIQRDNETRDREERIEELEALLRDRDQELRKKTEELKIKTNGRRETRGTSVPRSPRMGSGAMSPRPRFAQPAGGSRGGSPAPGDARDGFRDATLFPSSALASARWGHLNDR